MACRSCPGLCDAGLDEIPPGDDVLHRKFFIPALGRGQRRAGPRFGIGAWHGSALDRHDVSYIKFFASMPSREVRWHAVS